MFDYDLQSQKITKVGRRVAKNLIANDEAEISEVVRKRLFENLGGAGIRRNVAKTYDWCFNRSLFAFGWSYPNLASEPVPFSATFHVASRSTAPL